MEDLRPIKKVNKYKNKVIKTIFIKKWWKIALIILLILILLFPTECGQIIGQFINDFFGTIIEYSTKQ